MLLFGSLASSLFWDSEQEGIVHKDGDEDCECGCIWVSNGGGDKLGSTGSSDIGQDVGGIESAPVQVTTSDAYNSLSTATKKNLVYNMLPGAVLAYEMFGVYPSVVMGQKVQESGWTFKESNKHNYYGIKADTKWKEQGGAYHSVLTHEYVNGKKVYVYADFRSYTNIESGVLAQGDFLRSNPRYESAGVFRADGYREQLQAIKNAGYATDPNYVKNIADNLIGYNKFYAYDDINASKELMRELGNYEKYEELKAKVKAGEVLILYKTGIANIGGDVGSIEVGNTNNTNSSNNLDGQANGYWIGCNCDRPCELCDCHDNDTSGGNGLGVNGSGCEAWNMKESTSGEASGLFGDRAYLEGLIERIGSPYNIVVGGVKPDANKLKQHLRDLLDDMGKTSSSSYSYTVDKFKDSNDTGFIQYSQSKTPGEDYLLKGYNGGSTRFLDSACGIYSVAMILSTLERQYINPAEVAIVVQTLPVRYGKDMTTTQLGSSGALYSTAAVDVLKLAGYTNVVNTGSLDQSKLDATLEKGGLFLGVFKGSIASNSSGHFMVIREKDKEGNYLFGDSVKRSDTSYTFNQLKSGFKHTGIYVLPKEGKSVYDIKNSCDDNKDEVIDDTTNGGNSNSTESNNDIPYHPLKGQGRVTSNIFRSAGTFHGGVDIGASKGTPIYAMWDGTVKFAGLHSATAKNPKEGFGNFVTIQHTNGYYTTSAHMTKVATTTGARVKKGDLIGYVGSTGDSTGDHLHIEVLTKNSTYGGSGLFVKSSKEFVNALSVLKTGDVNSVSVLKSMVVVQGTGAKIIKKGVDFKDYQKYINMGTCKVGS